MGRLVLFLSFLAFAGTAAADDDSMRMGGRVVISQAVEGSLSAVGGRIVVDAPVAGSASLAGGSMTVNAPVTGNLRAAGGHVTINAAVGGDVSVAAGKLELGPEARIAGKLSFRGGELKQDPAAQVTGAIDQRASRSRPHREHDAYSGYTQGWLWTLGLASLAALIAAGLPGPSARMAQELRERPWVTALVGLVALTAIPMAAVLFMVTLIGIPIGLLAMAGYAALLLIGYVWVAVVVGGLLLDRVKPETAAITAWRAGAAVLAMLTLALLTRLPFVGGIFALTALVVGVGMVIAATMRKAGPEVVIPA